MGRRTQTRSDVLSLSRLRNRIHIQLNSQTATAPRYFATTGSTAACQNGFLLRIELLHRTARGFALGSRATPSSMPLPREPDGIDGNLPIFSDPKVRNLAVQSTDGTKWYSVSLTNYTCTC